MSTSIQLLCELGTNFYANFPANFDVNFQSGAWHLAFVQRLSASQRVHYQRFHRIKGDIIGLHAQLSIPYFQKINDIVKVHIKFCMKLHVNCPRKYTQQSLREISHQSLQESQHKSWHKSSHKRLPESLRGNWHKN